MRVAVTGSSGLIGSALLPVLRRRGARAAQDRPARARGTRRDRLGPGGRNDRRPFARRGRGDRQPRRCHDRHPLELRRGSGASSSRGSAARGCSPRRRRALEPRPQTFPVPSGNRLLRRSRRRGPHRGVARGDGFLPRLAEAVGGGGAARARRRHARRAPSGTASCSRAGAVRSLRLLLPFRLGLGGRVGSGDAVVELDRDRGRGRGVRLRPRPAALRRGQPRLTRAGPKS